MATSDDTHLSGLDCNIYSDSPTPIPYCKQPIKQIENVYGFSPPPPIPRISIHMKTKGHNVMGNKNTLLIKDSHQNNSIGYDEQRNFSQNHYLFHNRFEIDKIDKNIDCENTNSNKHKIININDNINDSYHDVDECKHLINDVDDILHKQGLPDGVCKHKVYVQCYNNHESYCVKTNPNANDDKTFDYGYGFNDTLQNEGSFELSKTYKNMQQIMEKKEIQKKILLLEGRKQDIMLKLQKITAKLNIEIQRVNTDIKIQKLILKNSKHK